MSNQIMSDQEFAVGREAFSTDHEYRLHCLRHSTAHITAAAIQQLFPEAQFAIGPPVKDRFYYDVLLPRTLTPEDLEEIERRMRSIVASDEQFHHETWSKRQALDFFEEHRQPFKSELIGRIPDEEVSIYRVGEFTDLCKGPHISRTSECGHFKLTSVSGAYWRGDEKQPMLQRIYGTVWPTQEELEEYLHNVEQAKERDHRKLASELDLLMIHPWAPGAVFWLPKGTVVYQTLQERMRRLLVYNGYLEVKAPLLFNADLFKQSGHWQHYRENMFVLTEAEEAYGLKPMNCPGHMLIFNSRRRSYRELPLRLAEQSVLHRNERKGTLSGLTRVRQFQQDDAHIFITEDQIGEEVGRILGLMRRVYSAFNMSYRFVLSTRNEKNCMGELALWDKAEDALRAALEANGLAYEVRSGEAAFYGPKIDQLVEDSLKREHQLGTIQADFQLPRNFGLTYINSANAEATPVVIHRAIYGSLERLIGILIEHYAGAFPVWLAPVQVKVMSISEKSNSYATEIGARLRQESLRVEVDTGNDKIGAKIRIAQTEKVPYMIIVGEKEMRSETVSVRSREHGDEGALSLAEAVSRIATEAAFSF